MRGFDGDHRPREVRPPVVTSGGRLVAGVQGHVRSEDYSLTQGRSQVLVDVEGSAMSLVDCTVFICELPTADALVERDDARREAAHWRTRAQEAEGLLRRLRGVLAFEGAL